MGFVKFGVFADRVVGCCAQSFLDIVMNIQSISKSLGFNESQLNQILTVVIFCLIPFRLITWTVGLGS